jgi:DNA-binding LacI/PurR family transcriptional regulator
MMGCVSSEPRRAPTIRDVALRAGVGLGTVSRVLNDSPLVREDKRARVLSAIEELGFRRNATARSLSVGRTHNVGVVAPFFTSPSSVERLRGVAACLSGRGYGLLLVDVETPGQRARVLGDVSRLDGLLVISLRLTDDEVRALVSDGVPTVLVDVEHPDLVHVAIDDVRGGVLATEHLLAKGHRRIGFVGDQDYPSFGFTSSERRRRGFHQALERAGIAPEASLELLGGHDRDDASRLAEPLLRRADRPTAVFAASDVQALGVLEAAQGLGLRVPADLAVIGFDDIELAAVVGLTTVRQALRQSGFRGAELLLATIEGDALPSAQLDPLAVIERRTT